MRGKVSAERARRNNTGITPAYAGKSFQVLHYLFVIWDHPRVCGEKMLSSIHTVTFLGSPPRMRGKATPLILGLLRRGITPAYAGKRASLTL